jgi:hypothetical protein
VVYEGEQHGFRKAANIQHSLLAELTFYSKVLGFTLPEGAVELDIIGTLDADAARL